MTIARAIELQHKATIVAALAYETANFYQKAGQYYFISREKGMTVLFVLVFYYIILYYIILKTRVVY